MKTPNNEKCLSVEHRAAQWIAGQDTGLSSINIWAVMMGVRTGRPYTPADGADFGRCYRLLQIIPEWRERLPEVAAKYPTWGPMVREWDRLTEIYERDCIPTWRGHEIYAAIKELEREAAASAAAAMASISGPMEATQ